MDEGGCGMELRFRVPAADEMERPPTQRDQFDNDDVELVDALVRESIQNSLDAKRQGALEPVRVCFRIEELSHERLSQANALLRASDLNEHLQACDLPLIEPTEPLRSLIIEDFGTTGLTGSWSSLDEMPFSDFWRRMGRSHKSGQALGRWGLGKLVFSSSSKARVFFGLTIREGEDCPLLMGQAVLTTHQLKDGTRQDSHGFYAQEGVGLQLPIRDAATLDSFCHAFGIIRNNNPGLSIAIPYLRDGISHERIIKGVLRNYFFPILYGRLKVAVGDVEINEKTFSKLTESIDPSHFAGGDLASFINAMKESRSPSAALPIILPDEWAKLGSLDVALAENLEPLRSRLNDGEVVVVRAPILLKRKSGVELKTYVDVFLGRAKVDSPALFVRGSIVLNAESKYFRGKKIFSALIADHAEISEFLGDAENPAHTGWSASAEKVSGRWRSPRDRLSDVRGVLQKVHNALVSAVETLDKEALVSIFSIPSEDGVSGPKRKGEKVDKGALPKIPVNPRSFHVVELRDGFRIRAGSIDESDIPFSIRVRLAYDVIRGNPFRKHDPADFDLREKQLSFNGKGVKLSAINAGTLKVDVHDKDFVVDVLGFDRNRDLIIDPERIS
jgi:hypothetical protein